jgi:hypothetical protein
VKVVSQARILALQAQSDESLNLIGRGNSTVYSDDFNTVVGKLGGLLGQAGRLATSSALGTDVSSSRQAFQEYQAAHQKVADLATSGAFDKATTQATGVEASVFDTLNNRLSTTVNRAQQQFSRDAASARRSFRWLGISVIVLAVLIGLLALLGTQQRINDYR